MKIFILLLMLLNVSVSARTRHQMGFPELVGLGQITGASALFKFGLNEDINIGTPEDCWGGGGDYNWIVTPTTLSIVSDDADDTTGGTGAIAATVSGLDANYDLISEVVTLSGLTPVTTTLSFQRVHDVIINSVGASGYNEGQITISSGGSEVGRILATEGQTTIGVYTVPRGYKLMVYKFVAGLGKKQTTSGNAHFEIRPFSGSWNLKQIVGLSNSASFERSTHFPLVIPEKTDVRIRFHDISANNTSGICSIDGILLNESKFTGY